MNSQDEDLGFRRVPPEQTDNLQAMHGRQLGVENDHVPLVLTDELHKPKSVGGSRHDRDYGQQVKDFSKHLREQGLLVRHDGSEWDHETVKIGIGPARIPRKTCPIPSL